jgi:hypothetical protein
VVSIHLALRDQHAPMINNAAEATIRPVTVYATFISSKEWFQSVEITTMLGCDGPSTTYSSAGGNAAVQGKNTQLGYEPSQCPKPKALFS